MVGYEFESGPTPEELALKKAWRKKIRRRTYAAIVAVMVVAVWAEPDVDDLYEMCTTLKKPAVYRTIEAAGYYDGRGELYCGSCWRLIGGTNFDFVEFSYTPSERNSPIEEPGIYRARKVPAASIDCDAKITNNYVREDPRRVESPEGKWCFALDKIETPEARYGQYYEWLGTVGFNQGLIKRISEERYYFVDHDNDEVVAEAVNYVLDLSPWLQLGQPINGKTCNLFYTELGRWDLHRDQVIKSTGRWTNERNNRGGIPSRTSG